MIFVLSLAVCTLFSHIWEVSCDTILHCYCIDSELQKLNGKGEAKHARQKLLNVMLKAKRPESESNLVSDPDNNSGYM